MTSNDLERRNSPYLAFFSFASRLCHSGWMLKIVLCPSSSLPLLAITNPPAARSVCDSWAILLQIVTSTSASNKSEYFTYVVVSDRRLDEIIITPTVIYFTFWRAVVGDNVVFLTFAGAVWHVEFTSQRFTHLPAGWITCIFVHPRNDIDVSTFPPHSLNIYRLFFVL